MAGIGRACRRDSSSSRVGRRAVIAAGVGAVVLVGWGVAAASIPDANGTVHACYNVKNVLRPIGDVRIVDASTPCQSSERAIGWNQPGPTGPTGPAGPAGAAGPAGPSGSPGLSDGWYRFGSDAQTLAHGVQTSLVSVDLPAGSYEINGSATFFSSSGARVDCDINVGGAVKEPRFTDVVGYASVSIPLVATVGAPTTVSLECFANIGTPDSYHPDLTAVAIQNVH
jgi:hypothetical protein